MILRSSIPGIPGNQIPGNFAQLTIETDGVATDRLNCTALVELRYGDLLAEVICDRGRRDVNDSAGHRVQEWR